MEDVDWDLQAVVRGCFSTVPTWPPEGEGCTQQKSTFYGENNVHLLTHLFQPTSDDRIQKFMNNCNPLNFTNLQPPSPPQSSQISPFSFTEGCQDPPYNHQQQEKQFQVNQQSLGISRCTTPHAQGATKIKKRKNLIKKVCQVLADGSPTDLWSWRKYGQKPIKGSPYPRGYYRCSTLKGCSARKQVERNRSDPGMLIITYTGEHTHPVPTQVNSGSIRNKTTTSGDDDSVNKPTPPSPPPVTEKMDDTDDDNNFDVAGLVIDEDTFDGLDELVGSAAGEIFSDHHETAAPPFPWWSNSWASPPPLPAGVDF